MTKKTNVITLFNKGTALEFAKYEEFRNYEEFRTRAFIRFNGTLHLEEREHELLNCKQHNSTAYEYLQQFEVAQKKYNHCLRMAKQIDDSIDISGRAISVYRLKQCFLRNMSLKDKATVLKGKFDTMKDIKITIEKIETQRKALREFSHTTQSNKLESFAIEQNRQGFESFAFEQRQRGYQRGQHQRGHQRGQHQRGRCFKCGRFGHWGKECPNGLTCFECGKIGHKSYDCPNKGNNKLNSKTTSQ
eukprot:897950_1